MKVRIIKANGVQKKQDYFGNVFKFDGNTLTITASSLNLPNDWATSTWGTDTGNNLSYTSDPATAANGHAYHYSSSS